MKEALLQTLKNIMRQHKKAVLLTADMGFSVFEEIQTEFGDRFINTGITEQSTISVAAGLAHNGFIVYVYAQAPFITARCYEQIRLDVSYSNSNVKIIGTAAGISLSQLGVSHFALEDVALMRNLPNMKIFTPGDPFEAEWAIRQSYDLNGPAYIRIGKTGNESIHNGSLKIAIGKGIKIYSGNYASIFVSGSLLYLVKKIVMKLVQENIHVTLISLPTIEPLDKSLILHEAKKTGKIITIEEHSIIGGLGSAAAEILAESGISAKLYRFGTPELFTNVTGSNDYLLDLYGLSFKKILKKIIRIIK